MTKYNRLCLAQEWIDRRNYKPDTAVHHDGEGEEPGHGEEVHEVREILNTEN